MSMIKIAEFLKISGSFDGGRSGERWFSLPKNGGAARYSQSQAAIVPDVVMLPRSATRASGFAREQSGEGSFPF